jgi:Cu/Ag efflux protein CusF
MRVSEKSWRGAMRKIALAAVGTLVLSVMFVTATMAQAPMVNGQVTRIDEAAGKITLKHGPIKKLEMNEGMTMVFRVQDPAMLKRVKVGDKVKFDADRVNGQITVTKIEKAK